MYFTKDKKIMSGVGSTLYEMHFAVHNCENEKKTAKIITLTGQRERKNKCIPYPSEPAIPPLNWCSVFEQ